MTKQLYYEDAYLKEFDARVIACRDGENGIHLYLDKSAFFPEGGGQDGDFQFPAAVADIGGQADNQRHGSFFCLWLFLVR